MEKNFLFNITDYCLTHAYENFPKKTAIVIANDINQFIEISYEKFYEDIAAVSYGLQETKILSGSTILIHSIKSYDFLVFYFAALAVGLVVIASLANLTVNEINKLFSLSHSDLYFRSKYIQDKNFLPQNCTVFNEDNIKTWIQKYPIKKINFFTHKRDPAFIIFTSGSTAEPKGVVHAQDVVIARKMIREQWLDLRETDRVLVTGKPCWTYSMGVGFFDTFSQGATAIVYNGVESDDIWFRLIEKLQITLLASSPIYYKQCLRVPPRKFNIASLRQAVSAGEVLPYSIIEYWKNEFNLNLYEALGMTEMSTFINSGPAVPIKKGFVGKIQKGRRVSILPFDENDAEIKPDEIGLLAIHKDCAGFMLYYLGEKEKKSIKFRGPWFITGDLVSYDQENYIQYHGRFDDILNTEGGHRVSPVEIEKVLIKHPKIIEVACGLTDEGERQNVLTAFFVSNEVISSLEFNDFLSDKLSPNKTPKKFIKVDELPKNTNGKINRKGLDCLRKLKCSSSDLI